MWRSCIEYLLLKEFLKCHVSLWTKYSLRQETWLGVRAGRHDSLRVLGVLSVACIDRKTLPLHRPLPSDSNT